MRRRNPRPYLYGEGLSASAKCSSCHYGIRRHGSYFCARCQARITRNAREAARKSAVAKAKEQGE